MDIFNENMKCLKENRENIYEKLEEIIDKHGYDVSKFSALDAKNDEKIIQVSIGNKNVRLNSIYNPKKEAEHWSERYEFNAIEAPILMFGNASGIFTREMLSRVGKDAVAIIVEPDISLFIFCLHEFDLTDIIANTRIIMIIDKINYEELVFGITAIVGVENLGTQLVCVHPKFDEIYNQKLKEFFTAIRKI